MTFGRFGTGKLEWFGYPIVKKICRYDYSFWQISQTWQTDRQTATAWRHKLRLNSVARQNETKRLALVARLPPAFYIVPHAGWNHGIVTPFYNSKFRRRLKCWPTWSAFIHWKKQTLVFLIHAHFAVTTVLSNVHNNHFFQQNKLTITFNKMITSGKSDWSYPPCQPPKWAAC